MNSFFSRFSCNSRFIIGVALAFLLLSLSCSKSTDPDTNKPPDAGPVGILLSGADTDPALSGTSNHGPFVVPESEWDGDFVTTRLEAVINPSATVGEVNAALNTVGARLSCMRYNMMFTELAIPFAMNTGARLIYDILHSRVDFPNYFDPEYYMKPGMWGGPKKPRKFIAVSNLRKR